MAIGSYEQAVAHLHNLVVPALARAYQQWNLDEVPLDDSTLGDEVVLLSGIRCWEIHVPHGPIVPTHPFQWLLDNGQIVFTHHAPRTNDSVFVAEITAGPTSDAPVVLAPESR